MNGLEPSARSTDPADPAMRVSCPACASPAWVGCYTPIAGHNTSWTHDARVYKAMGVRSR